MGVELPLKKRTWSSGTKALVMLPHSNLVLVTQPHLTLSLEEWKETIRYV
jgi:hypothetical protein